MECSHNQEQEYHFVKKLHVGERECRVTAVPRLLSKQTTGKGFSTFVQAIIRSCLVRIADSLRLTGYGALILRMV